MKMLAIIQTRLNSDRFPRKVLADLGGKPVLKHVIDRVRQAAMVSDVVVAIAGDVLGPVISGHCWEWGVRRFLDSGAAEDDVLARLVRIVSSVPPRIVSSVRDGLIIRVCDDDPLVAPSAIDALCRAAKDHPSVDYVGYRDPDGQPMIKRPTGWFAEVVTTRALRRADHELAEGDGHREHVTSWMYENPDRYPCYWLDLPTWYTDNDLPDVSIDTKEDLERVAEFMASEQMNPGMGWPFK